MEKDDKGVEGSGNGSCEAITVKHTDDKQKELTDRSSWPYKLRTVLNPLEE